MNSLKYNRDGFVIVYTHGVCFNKHQPNAVAGFGIYWGHNHPLNRSEPIIGLATKSRADIHGATQAIWIAANAGIGRLLKRTDSLLLVRSWCEWIPKWKQNGWRCANGAPIRDEYDLRELDRAICDNGHMRIDFQFVRAHSNDRYGDAAEYLARFGAQKYGGLQQVYFNDFL